MEEGSSLPCWHQILPGSLGLGSGDGQDVMYGAGRTLRQAEAQFDVQKNQVITTGLIVLYCVKGWLGQGSSLLSSSVGGPLGAHHG